MTYARLPEMSSFDWQFLARHRRFSNDPEDGRHFGIFLVQIPEGVALHRGLADDMGFTVADFEAYIESLRS